MGLKLSCRCPLPLHEPIQTSCRYGQGNEGNEGDEGNEEEEREHDREGDHVEGDGAPWQQGENRWWLDRQRFDQEQARQGCEQEVERQGQEIPMDRSLQQGTQGFEDHGLRRDQEGLPPVRESEGVLQRVSAELSQT